ncbi:MAG TPA: flagellar motor protein MotB [Verrucomicrobiae bacterium]
MKNNPIIIVAFAGLLVLAAATGCRTDYGAGSPYQPGPTAGKVVGGGVGVVAGNVAGFGVGVAQGTVHGVASTFDPSYHMVRYWKTEITPDGRAIQVPYDILVDQYGRPAKMPAPTGNPAPPAQNAPPATADAPAAK